MKVLVFGSNGFIGRNVVKEFSQNHQVITADRGEGNNQDSFQVDLLQLDSVINVLNKVKPDVIVNCAGSVENSEAAMNINPVITMNMLQAVLRTGIKVKKIIISGSAGEYGIVENVGPVPESTPVMGNSFYARSKVAESSVAVAFKEQYGLPVVVARIFNPIGAGMHPRFLLPKLISLIEKSKAGESVTIEVNRLDARRDYINVKDIATAIRLLVEKDTKHTIYNIGSGHATTNGELLELVSNELGVDIKELNINETADQPEPNFATLANTDRIKSEIGWTPSSTLEDTVAEIHKELISA